MIILFINFLTKALILYSHIVKSFIIIKNIPFLINPFIISNFIYYFQNFILNFFL